MSALDDDANKTIGDFRFGLSSQEDFSEFNQSLARELEPIIEWGEVPPGTTYWDVVDAILDTVSGYAQIASIPATELPTLIYDVVTQLQPDDALDGV